MSWKALLLLGELRACATCGRLDALLVHPVATAIEGAHLSIWLPFAPPAGACVHDGDLYLVTELMQVGAQHCGTQQHRSARFEVSKVIQDSGCT